MQESSGARTLWADAAPAQVNVKSAAATATAASLVGTHFTMVATLSMGPGIWEGIRGVAQSGSAGCGLVAERLPGMPERQGEGEGSTDAYG